MIIKSMARKTASFGQLVKYMNKGTDSFKSFEVYHRNVYGKDGDTITREFKNNAEFLHKRKGGNYLYHEIISITRNPELSLENQKELLYNIVKDYIELRAKNNLVYGVMHLDHSDNIHFHLMISANELQSEKRHRLTKSNFSKIQREIEKFVLNEHPELKQKIIYNQHKSEKTKKEEYELKRRTGKESQRDRIKRELTEIFETSKNKADFFNLLANRGYEIYIRGKSIGVRWKETGRNYRLKTLGLEENFNAISNKLEELEHRKEEVKGARYEQEKEQSFKTEKVDLRNYRNQGRNDFNKQEAKQEPAQEKDIDELEKENIEIDPIQAELEKRRQELRKSRIDAKEHDKNLDIEPDNDKSFWVSAIVGSWSNNLEEDENINSPKLKSLIKMVKQKFYFVLDRSDKYIKQVEWKMIDILGILDSFIMAFNTSRSMTNPSDETENERKERNEEYKQAVINREKRERRNELKRHRRMEQSKNNDYNKEPNR